MGGRAILLIVAVLVLCGCVSALLEGDERHVTIGPTGPFERPEEVASAHCNRFGKREEFRVAFGNTVTFDCVADPVPR